MKTSTAIKTLALTLGLAVTGSALAGQGKYGPGPRMNSDMVNRELTAEQVKDEFQSRMRNDNLKVGKVVEKDDGYTVSIVTVKSGDLVRELKVARNGMPAHVKERFENGGWRGRGRGHHGRRSGSGPWWSSES